VAGNALPSALALGRSLFPCVRLETMMALTKEDRPLPGVGSIPLAVLVGLSLQASGGHGA
jgi:hypothetical protein